jgi:hypothetical protein
MNMRCPVCRALEALAGNGESAINCRRCKADLGLMVRLEATRAAHLSSAALRATRREAAACLTIAKTAHRLRADPASGRALALGLLLNRDFAGAWKAYQDATGASQ